MHCKLISLSSQMSQVLWCCNRGRVSSSLMPRSSPARGHVLSLVLCMMEYPRCQRNNKTFHPTFYLYRQCHLVSLVYNVISVKLHQEMCHRLIFLFQQHTHQHESLHSINSHSRPHFCTLIGRHKLQVITTRFFTAETMGIYSSGFLFKLSAGESQSPAAYFPTISCTSALPPQIQQFHIQN